MTSIGATDIGRPPKGKSTLTKQIILDDALCLLDETGERGVSFRVLGKRLGVTAMAVSHHVGSRQEMFAALVAMVYEGVGVDTFTDDPRERIRELLERYCERVIAHPNLALCVFSDTSLLSKQLITLTRKVREALRACGTKATELGTLVGVFVDYTHGFAISMAASKNSTGRTQTLMDYRRGLDWLLSSLG